jgi:hypothetical protein
MGLGPTRERLVDPMTEPTDEKPISAYERLISNLDFDNRVQRSDGVVGVITQVYPDWAMWVRSEPSDTEFYQTIDESNASEFTVLEKS